MNKDLESMSTDELWHLHESITAALAEKMIAEKDRLEARLMQLNGRRKAEQKRREKSERRPYPRVFPKFCNPDEPLETWAGRGKQPRWLIAQLNKGKRIEDFRIDRTARTGTPRIVMLRK
jgi:DNA-binding protein H-NS